MVIGAALEAKDAIKKWVPGMHKLTKAMDELRDSFARAMDFGDEAQKASLALGTTFEQTNSDFAASIQGLRGSIDTQFRGAFMALEAGLQGNTAGVAKLINQQMLTGTAFANTARVMANLVDVGGLSLESMNLLSADIIKWGNQFGVSTDILVGALKNLSDAMPVARLSGMSENLTKAVARFQAEIGAPLAGSLQKAMSLVMDPSLDSFARLHMLGMGQAREQLTGQKSVSELLRVLKDNFGKAADQFTGLAGGINAPVHQIGIASKTLGKEAMHMRIIMDQLNDHAREQNKTAVDYANTLSTLKSEVLAPLHKALATKFFPPLRDFADVLSAIGHTLADWAGGWITSLGGASKMLKDLQLLAIDGGVYITEIVRGTMEMMKKAFHDMFSPGGWWDIAKVGLLSFRVAIQDLLVEIYSSFFFSDVAKWEKAQKAGADLRGDVAKQIKANKDGWTEYTNSSSKRFDNVITILNKFRGDIEKGGRLSRVQNDYLAHLAELRNKELEIANSDTTTGSQALVETRDILGENLARIMGISTSEGSPPPATHNGKSSGNVIHIEEALDARRSLTGARLAELLNEHFEREAAATETMMQLMPKMVKAAFGMGVNTGHQES